MLKIIIFADSYKHFNKAIEEYEKRLWKNIEIIKLKPSKNKKINEIIKNETSILNKRLSSEKWFKILLDINWKNLSSKELNSLIEEKKHNFSNIIFIIWWAYWLDIEKLNSINLKISFSKMTFPHSLVYLMLLEQIYRTIMIKKWSWYHH